MPQHDVTFSVPRRPVGNADVQFSIKKDGKQLGRLKVSKGSLVWYRGKAKRGRELDWTQVDNLLYSNGKVQD